MDLSALLPQLSALGPIGAVIAVALLAFTEWRRRHPSPPSPAPQPPAPLPVAPLIDLGGQLLLKLLQRRAARQHKGFEATPESVYEDQLVALLHEATKPDAK